MENYGFIRVAAAVPKIKVADVKYNVDSICSIIDKAEKDEVSIVVFPELSVTGYTCGDLFLQTILIRSAEEGIKTIMDHTRGLSTTVVVGVPVTFHNKLYNCAAVIHCGEIKGIVPKCRIPSYGEFYETRWFSTGEDFQKEGETKSEVSYAGKTVLMSPNMIFKVGEADFAIEICEDLWTPIPVSSYHVLAGADIVLNLSASNESVMKHNYRKSLIANQSARTLSAYVYASCGYGESSQDLVFGGAAMVYENGSCLAENKRFSMEVSLTEADIDIDMLKSLRNKSNTFGFSTPDGKGIMSFMKHYTYQDVGNQAKTDFNKQLLRYVEPHPFLPSHNAAQLNERAEEITSMQVTALATRLEHINCNKVVIGISGGLDSTLALIIACMTYDCLGKNRRDIIGVTMPGFGTSDRTHLNAKKLMEQLGVDSREISIVPAVNLHFQDIGHNPEIHNVTFENSQARERTQLLMDIANEENGIVLGTGDLSELALGWETYNGDHMSMYAINAGIPKTLVRHLVTWLAENKFAKERNAIGDSVCKILLDITDTPISPELTPADKNGKIAQKTEDIVGPYELHDFFLYNVFRYGFSPAKILFLALKAFHSDNNELYTEETIKKWLKKFYWRFFSQQFKRSCMPDGPKLGSVSLSPRGDWRMPSDASVNMWIENLEN